MEHRAYVLIETAMGKSREVVTALEQFDCLESAERLAGPYDVMATIRARAVGEIHGVINDVIRPIDGIIRIVVCQSSTLLDAVTQT
jgi:DNA-binding Lrp family transcriptional regulator